MESYGLSLKASLYTFLQTAVSDFLKCSLRGSFRHLCNPNDSAFAKVMEETTGNETRAGHPTGGVRIPKDQKRPPGPPPSNPVGAPMRNHAKGPEKRLVEDWFLQKGKRRIVVDAAGRPGIARPRSGSWSQGQRPVEGAMSDVEK